MNETLSPGMSKAVWIDRCVMSIGKLKPEMSIVEAQTVVENILWSDDIDTDPEVVALAWANDLAYR
jgi:hypothetical protein